MDRLYGEGGICTWSWRISGVLMRTERREDVPQKGNSTDKPRCGENSWNSFSIICVGTQLVLSKVSLVDVPYLSMTIFYSFSRKSLGMLPSALVVVMSYFIASCWFFSFWQRFLLEMVRKTWNGAKYNHIHEFPLPNTERSKVKK